MGGGTTYYIVLKMSHACTNEGEIRVNEKRVLWDGGTESERELPPDADGGGMDGELHSITAQSVN